VKVSLSATIVASLVTALACVGQLQAQQGPPGVARTPVSAAAPSGTNVAVIDIASVFKSHNRFNAAMNDIKKDIEDFETFVRNEQTKFNTKREQLATFKPASLEYKQLEEELARTQSDLQVKVGLKRKEFLEQEARVYYRVYREIEQQVGLFAQRNRIGLVLRFNGDEMKEDDRASVLQGVNRAVVYQSNLDITSFVLQQLNGNTPTIQPTPSPQGGATGINANRPATPQIPQPNRGTLR
jgi:Skp family chaperone for outer membrane proteins